MIALNLNVRESAYDKIVYFLSHLKDDVVILNRDDKRNSINYSNTTNIKEFRALSKHISNVDKNIDILSLEKDINSDIF